MSQAGISNSSSIISTIEFVTDSGTASTESNIININGGSGITTSGSSDNITISLNAPADTWFAITSDDNPINLINGQGYIAKGPDPVNFVLPITCSVGESFQIAGYSNLWEILQNSGQSITFAALSTTPGVGGNLSATSVSDSLQMICVTEDLEFKVISAIGNLNLN